MKGSKEALYWRYRNIKYEELKNTNPFLAQLYKKGYIHTHSWKDGRQEWQKQKATKAVYNPKTQTIDLLIAVHDNQIFLHKDEESIKRYL